MYKEYSVNDFFPVYVDAVIFRYHEEQIQVRLAKRSKNAERLPNKLCLEGVLMSKLKDSSHNAALNRLFIEKIKLIPSYTEQLPVDASPNRDPDGFSMAVPFLVLVESTSNDEYGVWENVEEFLNKPDDHLPFDHCKLIKVAYTALFNKSAYSDLPLKLLEQPFKFSDIRKVFETVQKTTIQRAILSRRILPLLNEITLSEEDAKKRDMPKYMRKSDDLNYFNKTSKAG